LKATLTPNEQTLIERRLTKNPAAYELFLRAKLLEETNNNRSSLDEYERTAAAYERVLAEDPSIGLVHARLTYLHGSMFWLGHLDPTPPRRARAESAMHAAMRLDPAAPETHYARGLFAYYCEYDWARGLSHYRQAAQGLPNDAALAGLIGYAHRRLGNWVEAVQAFERAITLNPRNLYEGGELASLLDHMRRHESARMLAARFAAMFPDDNFVMDTLARSEFALTGDQAAFLSALAKVPKAGRDPTGRQAEYERALAAHDFAGAALALSDPRLTGIVDRAGIISDPVALHRAIVAFLLGQRDMAKRFAEEAIVEFSRRNWTGRQRFMVTVGMAAAKGLAGRSDEATSELQSVAKVALRFDAYGGTEAQHDAARYLALLGRRDEALMTLREALQGPTRFSLNEIRHDPLLARLKDDPRFEEILKAAKPL
jgi:tetratricopeptide (TPR) repeat protein